MCHMPLATGTWNAMDCSPPGQPAMHAMHPATQFAHPCMHARHTQFARPPFLGGRRRRSRRRAAPLRRGGPKDPQKMHRGGLEHEGHPLSNTLRGAWAMPFAKYENYVAMHVLAMQHLSHGAHPAPVAGNGKLSNAPKCHLQNVEIMWPCTC